MASKTPPHNEEAERSLLGSILMDKKAYLKVAEFLRPEHFYAPANSEIYDVISNLFEKGMPIDMVTVADELKRRRKLKKAGGEEYLAELVESVPTASHAESYAKIVKDLSLRRQLITSSADLNEMGFDESRDVDEVLDEAERKIYSISQDNMRERFRHVKDMLKDVFDQAEQASKMKGSVVGIPTGFADLDKLLGGLQPSDLAIIAARPSVGKTSLALDIARNVAVKEKKSVAFFSLEMGWMQVMQRIVAAQARVSFWDMRTGKLPEEAFERFANVMGVLSESELYIEDTPGQSILEIKAKARRQA